MYLHIFVLYLCNVIVNIDVFAIVYCVTVIVTVTVTDIVIVTANAKYELIRMHTYVCVKQQLYIHFLNLFCFPFEFSLVFLCLFSLGKKNIFLLVVSTQVFEYVTQWIMETHLLTSAFFSIHLSILSCIM